MHMNFKRCAHIASTKSTECPGARNQGGTIGHPIRALGIFHYQIAFAYDQPV